MIRRLVALAAVAAAPAAAQAPPTPLFASDSTIGVTIDGPIGSVVRNAKGANRPVGGTMRVTGTADAVPVRLSARGLSRRLSDNCTFPPIRVDLAAAAAPTSLFAGQGRLKLVTHCQERKGFQRHLLLEYAAYRLYNLLTPASFRVRLAQVDYRTESGKPIISRYGFFIEDSGDLARRIGLTEVKMPSRIPVSLLRPAEAARMAVFEYMISNLDWAMNAGPPGEECCHNARLFGAPGTSRDFTVVPYDFDYSGLVDAPYAIAPKQLRVSNVRQRRYHGYCSYNAEALAAAAEMRAKRGPLLALFGQIPELGADDQRRAAAYLDDFFAKAATDEEVRRNLLVDCVR